MIFSCDLLSLYPAVHFLSMWFSGIMAIMNSKGDSASPWKMPLWMYFLYWYAYQCMFGYAVLQVGVCIYACECIKTTAKNIHLKHAPPTHTRTRKHTHANTHTHTHDTHAYIYIYIYIYIYTYMCVCIYIYIYIFNLQCRGTPGRTA